MYNKVVKKAIFLNVLTLFLFAFLVSAPIYAHPGRTAADGCHYCRTNCDKWGVPWYQRHCHGGGSVEGTQESLPTNIEPTNTPIPWPTLTSSPTRIPTSTNAPIPTRTPTPIPPTNTPTSIIPPAKSITPKVNKVTQKKQTTKKQKRSFWQWLFR